MGIKLSNASNVNHEETQHNLILTQIIQQFIVSNFIPILKRTTIAYFYVEKACDNNVHKNRAWKIEHTHNVANKLFNNYLLKKCVYSILHTLYSWFVNIIFQCFYSTDDFSGIPSKSLLIPSVPFLKLPVKHLKILLNKFS